MKAEPAGPHPSRFLDELGATDAPAMWAVAYLLAVQVVFLGIVFRNFFFTSQGYEFSGVAPPVFAALGLGATLTFAVWRTWQMRRRVRNSLLRERLAGHEAFNPLREILQSLIERSTVRRQVDLYYDTVNELALHVTERALDSDRVVVGLRRVAQADQSRTLVESMIAHEVSHLECRRTRFETWGRFAILLYVQIVGGLAAIVVGLAAYLRPRVDDGVAIASFIPDFDPTVMNRFILPVLLQLVVTITVVTFAYFILIRRELLHDVRSLQFTGQNALGMQRFSLDCMERRRLAWRLRIHETWRDALGLHPTPCQRARALSTCDWVALDATVYPALAGLIVTTPMVLGAVIPGIRILDSYLATTVGGALIYAVARADIGRFAALRLECKPWIRSMAIYGVLMSAGAMLVGSILTVRYAVTRIGWMAAWGVLLHAQGPRFVIWIVFFTVLVLALSYLVAASRLARDPAGTEGLRRWRREGGIIFLVIVAFAAESLQIGPVALLVALLVITVSTIVPVFITALGSRCHQCGRRRLEILALKVVCPQCGRICRAVPLFPVPS